MLGELRDKPLAKAHLNWYLAGSGRDFVEDVHLANMLNTDQKVKTAVWLVLFRLPHSGKVETHLELEQRNYSNDDFRYAFGAIDRLDLQVDYATGELHAWFQDRYEWHPFYPGLYDVLLGDEKRPTNCVHAAMVELKDSIGAADYWMKGEATVPLSAVMPSGGPSPSSP